MNETSAKHLIGASQDAELVFAPDLTIVACNEAYGRIQGVSCDALVGRHVRQAFQEDGAREQLIASLERVCRTRRPHRLAGPAPLAVGGGETAPSGTMINMPVLGADGGVKWILHSLDTRPDDGGDRPAMALALEAAEARLRSILQTVPDAMIIIDERGRIESLSTTAERLFGYTHGRGRGQERQLLMPDARTANSTTATSSATCATGERRIIGIGRIVVGQRKDGTTFPMHLTVGELRSAERHYFTGFIRDLTDQQLTETRLKELQSEVTHMSRFTALGEMASTLAHEINQPLTAINNYLRGCHRLLERIEGEQVPALQDALGKAADQALRAGQIIRRLREFVARGESERRIENLPKLIEDASTLALVGARENGDRRVLPARSPRPSWCWPIASRSSRSWST